jgi:hypothetical protein
MLPYKTYANAAEQKPVKTQIEGVNKSIYFNYFAINSKEKQH